MNNEEKLVRTRQLFADWEKRDWKAIIDAFAPEGTLHSVMIEPVCGRSALEELFNGFKDAIEALTIDIEYLGVIDGAVIAVRTDRMTVAGKQGALPAIGVILFDEQGRISLWREYFDRATLLHEMGAAQDWVSD